MLGSLLHSAECTVHTPHTSHLISAISAISATSASSGTNIFIHLAAFDAQHVMARPPASCLLPPPASCLLPLASGLWMKSCTTLRSRVHDMTLQGENSMPVRSTTARPAPGRAKLDFFKRLRGPNPGGLSHAERQMRPRNSTAEAQKIAIT